MVGHSEMKTRKPGSYEHTDHNYTGIDHDGHGPHPNAHMGSKNSHPPQGKLEHETK